MLHVPTTELQKRHVKWTSIDICVISSPNPLFDHLLESFRWDDSNKWSNIGFGEEIDIIEIKIHTYLEPCYDHYLLLLNSNIFLNSMVFLIKILQHDRQFESSRRDELNKLTHYRISRELKKYL